MAKMKLKMVKNPKAPKMPKAPKRTASNEVKQNYLKKLAEVKKTYAKKLADVKKENNRRIAANRQADALDKKIASARANFRK